MTCVIIAWFFFQTSLIFIFLPIKVLVWKWNRFCPLPLVPHAQNLKNISELSVRWSLKCVHCCIYTTLKSATKTNKVGSLLTVPSPGITHIEIISASSSKVMSSSYWTKSIHDTKLFTSHYDEQLKFKPFVGAIHTSVVKPTGTF